MNRWAVRLLGLLMLLVFAMIFFHLQQQLVKLQEQRGSGAPTASSP